MYFAFQVSDFMRYSNLCNEFLLLIQHDIFEIKCGTALNVTWSQTNICHANLF